MIRAVTSGEPDPVGELPEGASRSLLDPAALVIRFPPGTDAIQKVRKEAKYNHRLHIRENPHIDPPEPWYRLSVFADVAMEGESRFALLTRLVETAGLGGVRLDEARNSLIWVAVSADLEAVGFTFTKDGYLQEPNEHYSVDVGPEDPDQDIIVRFVSAFEGPLLTQELQDGVHHGGDQPESALGDG